MATRYRTDLFPFFLQGDQFVRGFFPLIAFLQGFGGRTNFVFERQVVFHLLLVLEIESPFVFEKLVAGVPETFVNFRIVFFGGESDGLPHFLDIDELFRSPVPLFAGRQRG